MIETFHFPLLPTLNLAIRIARLRKTRIVGGLHKAIALQMLSASNVNQLKALFSKYTRSEIVWVYQNLLSVPQRKQIVAVAGVVQRNAKFTVAVALKSPHK